ncbi:MAG TPA: class I SAM-dependent methyltransferase [Actinocrinis sp.]|nr:class I SAM-dependent methyltransferase [Actinocrinis sp.]
MTADELEAKDWHAWHAAYDDPDSQLVRRLACIQERITHFLDAAAPGPVSVISVCAGQGRDLLGVLEKHERGRDVTALLVELDPRIAETAREHAARAGLAGVTVVVGDAAQTDHYLKIAPADLVLVCGVFGNIPDSDIEHTIGHCAALCKPGGAVIWTRNRREPDLVPHICDWFASSGFTLEFVTEPLAAPDLSFGVGMHRHTGRARSLQPEARMFTFTGRSAG